MRWGEVVVDNFQEKVRSFLIENLIAVIIGIVEGVYE